MAAARSRSVAEHERGTKLPPVARRVGSSPPERKAPSSQSTERAKLPSIRPIRPGGYRERDMDPGKPPAAPPRPTRPPARPSAGAAQPAAKSAGSGSAEGREDLKNYVSDELRKVMEEEEVSYTWRRSRPNADRSPPSTSFAPAAPSAQPKVAPSNKVSQRLSENGEVKSSKKPTVSSKNAERSSGATGILEVKLETTGVVGAAATSTAPSFCAKLDVSVLPAVRLVTYDGSPPMLMAGPLCGTCVSKTARPPEWFLRWVEGRSSNELFSLAADDWLRAELAMEGSTAAPPGAAPPAAALLSGLLGDPATRSCEELSPLSPTGATSKALHEVLSALPLDEGYGDESHESGDRELLSSQVEVALGRGAGAATLPRALRRELLRSLWCSATWEGPSCTFDDQWLLQQLQRTEIESGTGSGTEQWRRENDFLDRYLVRLMKLKRSLNSLLESLQKVDHYAVLGISSSASDKELRNAYRKACLRLHPDKGGDKQQFQQLQESYARILEERQQRPTVPVPAPAQGPQGPAAAGRLSIEEGSAEQRSAAFRRTAAFSEAEPVASGVGSFKERCEEMRGLLKEVWAAEAKLKEIQGCSATVETLAMAQEAGEKLLELSQKIGELAPSLSDASMEVAESSLALAAKFSGTVPCALLLMDVALSMTLEATRVQQNGKTLLDMRRDTWGTLQTLQQNLSMARILGSVDAETFKLSVGLVRKATSRILQGIKEVQKASEDAQQRGHHCLLHADSVCRFAARRPADEDGGVSGVSAELEFPGEAWKAADQQRPKQPSSQATSHQPRAEAGSSSNPTREADTSPAPSPVEYQRRVQNQRLLLQLNAEVRELQRRAKALVKREKEETDASAFCHELLWAATDALLNAPSAELSDAQLLRATLAREFHFVEVAGLVELAVPSAFSAQLLRYEVQSGASSQLLEELLIAKRRVLEKVTGGEACVAVVEQHFEQLSASVVSAGL